MTAEHVPRLPRPAHAPRPRTAPPTLSTTSRRRRGADPHVPVRHPEAGLRVWNSNVRQAFPASFAGAESSRVWTVYRFERRSPSGHRRGRGARRAGRRSGERRASTADVVYSNERTLLVEPTSGVDRVREEHPVTVLRGPDGTAGPILLGRHVRRPDDRTSGRRAGRGRGDPRPDHADPLGVPLGAGRPGPRARWSWPSVLVLTHAARRRTATPGPSHATTPVPARPDADGRGPLSLAHPWSSRSRGSPPDLVRRAPARRSGTGRTRPGGRAVGRWRGGPAWPLVCLGFLVLALLQPPGRIVADTKLDLAVDPLGFLGRALHLWEPGASPARCRTRRTATCSRWARSSPWAIARRAARRGSSSGCGWRCCSAWRSSASSPLARRLRHRHAGHRAGRRPGLRARARA